MQLRHDEKVAPASAAVSGASMANGTTPLRLFASHLLQEVRAFALGRPHLNPFTGGESLRRKKLEGERPIRYEEVLQAVRLARREGKRRGTGAHGAAAILNAIVFDSLDDGESPDLVVTPCAPATPTPLRAAALEELDLYHATTDELAVIAAAIVGGQISERDLRGIRTAHARREKEFDDVLRVNGVRS